MAEPAEVETGQKRSKKQKRKERIARRMEEAQLEVPTPIIMPGQKQRELESVRKGPRKGNNMREAVSEDHAQITDNTALPLSPDAPVPSLSTESAPDPRGSTKLVVDSSAQQPKKKTRGPGKATLEALKLRNEAWIELGPIKPSENQEILTERWWSRSDLAQMKSDRGLQYTTGKFSEEEARRITQHLDNFKKVNRLDDEELRTIIFAKKLARSEYGPFWKELARAVPFRPIVSVCQYVQRHWHSDARKGPWTKEEDDALLAAKMTMGSAWVKISEVVERPPGDCKDRWQNHLQYRDTARKGPWTKEEEQELENIIKEQYGGSSTNPADWVRGEIAWSAISTKMGNKRTREQIMSKWSEQLARNQLGDTEHVRWSAYDAGILVDRLKKSGAASEADVKWSSLLDAEWNLFNGNRLLKRYKKMRDAMPGHEDMAFQDILSALARSYPVLSSRQRTSGRAHHGAHLADLPIESSKSKAVIVDSDDEATGAELVHDSSEKPAINGKSKTSETTIAASATEGGLARKKRKRATPSEAAESPHPANKTDSTGGDKALASDHGQPESQKKSKRKRTKTLPTSALAVQT